MLVKLLVDAFNVYVIHVVLHLLAVVLAHLVGVAPLLLSVVECADFGLVATASVAVYSLVLVGMIEAFNCGMTLLAVEPVRALLPTDIWVILVCHVWAVFRRVLKDLWRPSEVSHVMSVNTAFRVV